MKQPPTIVLELTATDRYLYENNGEFPMADGLTKFLGDTPAKTFVKLAIVSFVVGIIMSALNFTPYEVWEAIRDFFVRLYDLGFEAIWKIAKYFVWGAMVVVPIFLVLRLLRAGR